MVSEGRLELPAFAFVARCDDPISLLRRWGVLRELNSELQSHILPCCRYTKDATENGGVYGIRTREIPDRQSGGVDHWPNTPKEIRRTTFQGTTWIAPRDETPKQFERSRFIRGAALRLDATPRCMLYHLECSRPRTCTIVFAIGMAALVAAEAKRATQPALV